MGLKSGAGLVANAEHRVSDLPPHGQPVSPHFTPVRFVLMMFAPARSARVRLALVRSTLVKLVPTKS